MDFSVERAAPDDYEEMARLHFLSHTTSFAEFATQEFVETRNLTKYLEQWKSALENMSEVSSAWVVRIDGRVAGMVRVYPMESGAAQLSSMHVHPDFQGRGIGRALMSQAMSFIRVAGYRRAELGVVEANFKARGLYESAGWTVKARNEKGVEGVPYFVMQWTVS